MKVIFVKDLTKESGIVSEMFQVSQVETRILSNQEDKRYLKLKLRDRTGEIEARLWDIPVGLLVNKGDVIRVRSEVVLYHDELQLKLLEVKFPAPPEIRIEDYIPSSSRDRQQMLDELDRRIDGILNVALREAVKQLVQWKREKLRDAPAAKGNHQAYLGGLLEHILRLCRLVDVVCCIYRDLDRDILLTGAIVHDIGKVEELQWSVALGYSKKGALVGHIVQGSAMWENVSSYVDENVRIHVEHIIASHHGQLDWGAAVLPMTREAMVFHLLDMIDSKYEMYTNAVSAGVDEDGFTPWNSKLETRVWNGL